MKLLYTVKLRTKITFLILVIIISMSFLSFYVLNMSSNTYNNIIQKQTKTILDLYSSSFEQFIKSYDQVSFNILIDPDIQRHLQTIDDDAYNNYLLNKEIEDLLLSYTNTNPFISSIQIIDSSGIVHTSGLSLPNLDYDLIKENSHLLEGKVQWTVDSHYKNKLLLIRDIRQIDKLSLENIGTLIIAINLDSLLNTITIMNNTNMPSILIHNNGEIIYTSAGVTLKDLSGLDLDKLAEPIQTIDKSLYFVNSTINEDYAFIYTLLIPYDNIFNNLLDLRRQILAIIGVITLCSIIIGTIYSVTLTKPLEKLCYTMKHLDTDNLSFPKALSKVKPKSEEINYLYTEYESMLSKIDTLVNDQLKTQLVLMETKYRMLQSQINPHFLYNTLDSINWLARLNNEEQIAKMVRSLATILRASIDVITYKTTVIEEIELMNHYMFIQKCRYDNRLNYEYLYDPQVSNCLIPKMLVQPLLENAVHYALEPSENLCKIKLVIRKKDSKLVILVHDNGDGMEADDIKALFDGQLIPKGNGIGIANILERLKLLYDETYTFEIQCSQKQCMTIEITIPLEMEEASHV